MVEDLVELLATGDGNFPLWRGRDGLENPLHSCLPGLILALSRLRGLQQTMVVESGGFEEFRRLLDVVKERSARSHFYPAAGPEIWSSRGWIDIGRSPRDNFAGALFGVF